MSFAQIISVVAAFLKFKQDCARKREREDKLLSRLSEEDKRLSLKSVILTRKQGNPGISNSYCFVFKAVFLLL